MEKVTQQDIEQAISKASREVFETMLNLPLQIDPSVMRNAIEPETFHGVVALVGVAGSWTGTGHISCTSVFAQKLAGALLMTEYESVNEDVLDAVAEVANMIVGNVKTFFEEKLGPLGAHRPHGDLRPELSDPLRRREGLGPGPPPFRRGDTGRQLLPDADSRPELRRASPGSGHHVKIVR